jgi:coproporphyrinogen III oxidase-like Fe-S oxidoreductase
VQEEFSPELLRRHDRQGLRYPSYSTADRFYSRFAGADYIAVRVRRASGPDRQPLSLYVQLRFCNTVCC